MSCSKPLLAFVCGKLPNGKKDIRFAQFKEQTCFIKDGIPYTEKIEIPCGQCVGCRLQYSRQWADRLMMEAQDHEDAWFLTLTYDDENVPVSYYGNPESGDAIRCFTLRKKHLQDFFKRLRYYYPDCRLKYFACGELGEVSKRPHYHAIIFGLKLDDLQYYKRSNLSDVYYNSDKLNKVWNNGYVVVGSVTWESCAYVARYVMKKAKGINKEQYDLFNMEPEFVLMSRRPGIARNYYEKNKEKLYDYSSIYLSTIKGSHECKVPRYFKQITESNGSDDDIRKLNEYRESNKRLGKDMTDMKLYQTDLNIEQLRAVEEMSIIEKSKALRREL